MPMHYKTSGIEREIVKTPKFINKRNVIIALIISMFGSACILGIIIYSNAAVAKHEVNVRTDIAKLPKHRVGLLLGTGKYAYGRLNRFFMNRCDAAAALYHAGKIRDILISGDNSRKEYNEPQDMKEGLIDRGVPETAIHLDYAGFSTLDSIRRAEKVFKIKKLTVISQKFHCTRAIYIADQSGIDAVGFAADDVSGILATRTYLREYLARVKAVLQVELLNSQPKFLGPDPYGLGS